MYDSVLNTILMDIVLYRYCFILSQYLKVLYQYCIVDKNAIQLRSALEYLLMSKLRKHPLLLFSYCFTASACSAATSVLLSLIYSKGGQCRRQNANNQVPYRLNKQRSHQSLDRPTCHTFICWTTIHTHHDPLSTYRTSSSLGKWQQQEWQQQEWQHIHSSFCDYQSSV